MGRFGIGSLTFYTASLRHGNAVLGAMRSGYVVLCEGMVTLHVISLVIVVWCVVSARFDKVWLSSEGLRVGIPG